MKTLPPSLVIAALFATHLPGFAADWPQWRGPNRDGITSDPKHALNSLPAQPQKLWEISAGPGQASPVVVGDKLVFMDGQGGQETAHCLNVATGKQVWAVPVGPMVEFQNNYGEGPRCTPLIDGDRVYVQTCGGEFRCLSMADGKPLWNVSFGKDYGATFLGNKNRTPESNQTASRRHGNNGSAAIDGDRIFVPVGSPKGATLVCYDKKTGKELWRAGEDNTAYSSVMVATLAGTRQAVHFTADALMGVDIATGKILWRTPLKTGAKRHVCTPVISGDTVTVASSSIGLQKFRIAKAGDELKVEQAWVAPSLRIVLGTPVLIGKHLYTVGPGQKTDFLCVDFETGNQVWAQEGFADYASVTAVNDKLLALNANGDLYLIKANPAKYEELGRVKVCGETWASPAYVDGRIYVKDGQHLSAIQLAP